MTQPSQAIKNYRVIVTERSTSSHLTMCKELNISKENIIGHIYKQQLFCDKPWTNQWCQKSSISPLSKQRSSLIIALVGPRYIGFWLHHWHIPSLRHGTFHIWFIALVPSGSDWSIWVGDCWHSRGTVWCSPSDQQIPETTIGGYDYLSFIEEYGSFLLYVSSRSLPQQISNNAYFQRLIISSVLSNDNHVRRSSNLTFSQFFL